MSREGIGHALNRVRGELERITLDLADLDGHVGHRMLAGADLYGLTRERWEHADRHIRRLRATHGAFRRAVEEAAEHHAGGDTSDRVRLTFLLTGPCLEPPAEDPPYGSPDADTGHITLAEAVARMTADHEEATEVLSAAETAWNALHPRMADLGSLWWEVGTLRDMIEEADDGGDEPLRSELTRVGDIVRRDPLSLLGADHRVDTSCLERLRERLETACGELRDALRMRDSYQESTAHLVSVIDDLEADLAALREEHARVVSRIREPQADGVPDPVPGLRARIDEMDGLRARGRWRELGGLFGEVQAAVHAAADDIQERRENLAGLLKLRDGLRDRLEEHRALSIRLGLAGDPEVDRLHDRARRELWTVPGDLTAAEAALAAYRRSMGEKGVTETVQGRTTPGAGASDGENEGGGSR